MFKNRLELIDKTLTICYLYKINNLLIFPTGTASQLDLEGPLFVGALAPSDQGPAVPSEVWTAKLNYGYVGCLRQLVVNGKTVDLAAQAREQDSGSLRPSCHTSPSQCDSQPCLNGGLCSEGWNRFVCDCTRTGFTGPVCAKGRDDCVSIQS